MATYYVEPPSEASSAATSDLSREEIVAYVKKRLYLVEGTHYKDEKMIYTTEIMTYLAQDNVRWFFIEYPKFKAVVLDKAQELLKEIDTKELRRDYPDAVETLYKQLEHTYNKVFDL